MIIKWKKCFLDAIVLVLQICYCFLLEKQISKSSKWGRPQDVYGPQLRDVLGTRWWDVLGTSPGRWSNMFFKFNSETFNLLWQITRDFIMNCSSETFDLRTSKNLSQKYLSKPLWQSTFSLKESKSLQHSKENLFELCLNGYISMTFLFT